MWGIAERSRVLGSLTICGLEENDDDGVVREHQKDIELEIVL
jgi:hypothetical protein